MPVDMGRPQMPSPRYDQRAAIADITAQSIRPPKRRILFAQE